MRGHFKRVAASIVALLFLLPQAGAMGSPYLHGDRVMAVGRQVRRVVTIPPVRVEVKEPARIRPAIRPPNSIKPKLDVIVRSPRGVRVAGPPMLRPSQIDSVLKALDRRPLTRTIVVPPAGARRGIGAPGSVARPAARDARALPSDPNATGTGVNSWWPYQAQALPGGGQLMVNVGTGNLLLQDDDMSIPHKGVPLDFRRTYNSQSPAVFQGSNLAWTSLYGNGWTNSFDAHIVKMSADHVSVFDIDGTRSDYVTNQAGNRASGYYTTTAGQHAALSWDGACGFTWTKKSGTIYYFYDTNYNIACPSLGTVGAYAGRLHQIIGRNRNTYLSFNYSWERDDASIATGKVSAISVTTESGLTATLYFADVSGHRLLQQIVFPDGSTSVSYLYDDAGNLTWVSRPPNNAAGTRPMPGYIYSTLGTGSVMAYVTSPRWNGSDGGYIALGYNGTDAQSATVAYVAHVANVNPPIADGSASSTLQSGYPTTPYNFYTEYFASGAFASTYRDTNGHMMNWVIDGRGRPTQTQVCAASANQGQTCTGTWLVTNGSWDVNNNQTSVVDPRGTQTDMAYDASGNVVAIGQPPQYQGYTRPTALIDYDAYNNVTAVCDPVLVHSKPADWSGQYSGGADSYCSSQFPTGGHLSAQYTYPSYEPYGELASVTSAGGYTRQVSYNPSGQGGADFGLPTNVTGAFVNQFDGTSRRPSVSLVYDAHGDVLCSQTDTGINGSSALATAVMTYDALNRMIASADPDDASLAGSCSKTPGIAGSAIVTRSTYYANGSVQSTQTPSQIAAGSGTVITYDIDGNPTSEGPYAGSPANPQTPTTRLWYDGVARLVETQQPADPNTSGDLPISMRYLYDLSQNGASGSATTLNGTTVSAYGNMFDTLKNTPTGWIDLTFSAFDSADRVTTAYAFAPCPPQWGAVGAIYCSQPAFAKHYYWDSSSVNPNFSGNGLLIATVDGLGVTRKVGYNGLGAVDTLAYSGDGGRTPQVSYAYDDDGRTSDMWNAFSTASAPSENHVSFAYNADGNVYQMNNDTLNAIVAYAYYPDAMLAGVSAIAQTVVNQPNLHQYAYRNDYTLAKENFGAANQAVSWTYTLGGRMTAQSDFGGATSISAQYGDGHGRLSSYTTPSGMYGSFGYDALGNMTTYTDPYASVDGETVSSTYNIRGDLVGRSYSGGTASSKPGFQYKNIQGVLVQNPSTFQWDGRTGAMLSTLSGPFYYDAIGRLESGAGDGYGFVDLSYDGEDRIVQGDTFAAASAEDFDCRSGGAVASWVPPGTEQSYMYDGLGRMFQDRQPNTTRLGHMTTHIRQWIWNGSSSLFALNMNATWNGTLGANQGYSADGLGSIDPLTQSLTLTDHDFDGAAAQFHNSTGHSAWNASNPYNQFCISANGIPASSGYTGPGNAPVPSDGSSDPSLVVNSYGRGYLSSSMGFTTPDYSSATPYAPSSRRLLGRYDTKDKCPIGSVASEGGRCVPIIGNTRARPPWDDCDASSPQCGFLPTGGGDPFGFRDPRRPGGGGGALLSQPPQTTKSCIGGPEGLAIPPNAPGIPLAFDAGSAKRWSVAGASANIWRGGTFDYQRYGLNGPNGLTNPNPPYVPASNFAVGVYSNGAGVPPDLMTYAGVYKAMTAKPRTPAGALAKDVLLWNVGWVWAAIKCS